MITRNTLAAMIVPTKAPMCRKAPRPEKTWVKTKAAPTIRAKTTPASGSVMWPRAERQIAS